MFDGLQIFSNTTKHDQTQSNITKQGGQTVKCLVTKQCLMVFGRQTFPVWTGLKAVTIDDYSSLFPTFRDWSPLFALFETIHTIRDYSLFAIRLSGFPDTP